MNREENKAILSAPETWEYRPLLPVVNHVGRAGQIPRAGVIQESEPFKVYLIDFYMEMMDERKWLHEVESLEYSSIEHLLAAGWEPEFKKI